MRVSPYYHERRLAVIGENDKLRFEECRRNATLNPARRDGIGRLGERTLHQILKYYFEPDDRFHEIKAGRYVADICRDGNITEIQTRAFRSLRGKLKAYSGKYNVNVVFPIAVKKYLSWVSPETGEIISRRKSPKKGKLWDILYELYALRPDMPLDGVKFTLVLCEVEDFKLLNGYGEDKKKGAARFERIPTELCDIVTIKTTADYGKLIPPSLGESFTAAEFAKAAKMTRRTAGRAIQTLVSLGVIKHISTEKRTYIYGRTEL